MTRRRWLTSGFLAAMLALLPGVNSSILAQEGGAPALPSKRSFWINSSPISLEQLKGKSALLYFFEESSPKVQADWPKLMRVSQQYKDRPIVFIAINSGNPPAPLSGYAKRNRIKWPILADWNRAFEKACSLAEISKNNATQVRLILPDGRLTAGSSVDLDAAASLAVKDAKWNVDPTDIPDSLKRSWQAIEFGNFPNGASGIKKGLRSKDDATKTAAEKLNTYVTDLLNAQLKEAEEAEAAGDTWSAYKIYTVVPDRFKGFDVSKELAAKTKELRKDEKVATEMKAMTRFSTARKLAKSSTAKSRKKGIKQLEMISLQQPDTEAAGFATKLLVKLRSN